MLCELFAVNQHTCKCNKKENYYQVAFLGVTLMQWKILIDNVYQGNLVAWVKAILQFYFEKRILCSFVCGDSSEIWI